MTEVVGAHSGLRSAQGAIKGEHPGRSANPVIKVLRGGRTGAIRSAES